MNTVVITAEQTDLGVGPSDRLTFVDCSWHVDEQGTLHIVRQQPNQRGNAAAFASGSWRAVVEGSVVAAEARR